MVAKTTSSAKCGTQTAMAKSSFDKKKNAVTKLIASAVIQQFLKFDYQKTKLCCQVLNPTPALQAATILVAMASEKIFGD